MRWTRRLKRPAAEPDMRRITIADLVLAVALAVVFYFLTKPADG